MRTASRRFMIDESMVQGGGGFTYAVNIIPRLARGYPGDRFRVFLRSPELEGAQDLPLEIHVSAQVEFIARVRNELEPVESAAVGPPAEGNDKRVVEYGERFYVIERG